jgi:hypothetical protein
MVYLEGGMWCWDETSCASRWQSTPFEMSSTGWKPTLKVGGVFSTFEENPWKDANKVYLAYCSSDAWAGDAPASAATGGWAFLGQRIIEATMMDLQVRRGMSQTPKVIFGGCSAGARGALFNLDYVAAMLPAGASVRGLLDSGLWLDMPTIDSTEVTLQQQTQMVMSLINPGARIPAACAAQYSGANEWKCLYGQYRLPFVETPYIINAAQFDSFQVRSAEPAQATLADRSAPPSHSCCTTPAAPRRPRTTKWRMPTSSKR